MIDNFICFSEVGGNLYDAVSMAVKSALYSTKVPVVTVSAVDGGEPELELSSDPFSHSRYNNQYIKVKG